MAAEHTLDGVPLSTLHPKYLHSNSTSHVWPFSAVAELIDNAYDPDVNAKQIWIDKTRIKDQDCLTFMDNGNGLCYDMMLKMLSFGYSDKKTVRGKQPIGMYGNGFKSGSMRLGKDVIVLSKSKKDLCVGMLSQSYLKKIGATEIIVPIISIKDPEETKFHVLEGHSASLRAILDHSPFNTEEELLTELQAIQSTSFTTGTRIIIWNLPRTSTGSMELDFTTDRYDIRIPSDLLDSKTEPYLRMERSDSSVPESDVSLRAFCSILYMKPRMQINIRGQKVKTRLISKSLAHIAKDLYKPSLIRQKVPITFGYNTMNKEQYGIMMYHKNRLIRAYHRVGCQINANNRLGVGVIGVIECNFLEPTHNKQDFDNTDKYRNMIRNVATKLEEYCKEIQHKRKTSNPNDLVLIEEAQNRPDQNWAQCDKCQQWRRLPDGIDKLPEEWFCHMNPDPQFRRCETEEEPEDSDHEQQSYLKTYKIQEKEEKRRQEEMKACVETATPKTPQTPRGGASACSPATSSGHPVISSVYSLSKTSPSLKKRLPPTTPQSEVKRQRRGSVRRRLDSDHSMSEPLTFHKDANNDHNLLEGSSTSPGNGAVEEMRDQSTQMKAPQVKDEEEMNISTAAYGEAEVTEEGRLTMAQEQQRQPMEMLQSVTYKEEVCYKEEVEELHAKLMELKEKQCADRETQEGETREAREKIEELSKEKEALLEAKSSLLQQIQEQAKQMKDFTCRADQSSNEIKNLHSKVKQLEEEKANISAEFEKNQSSLLQQIQEQAKQMKDLTCKADQSSNEIKNLHLKVKQLEEEKASISAEFEKNKSSLMELRSKVASLLN